ncbi:6280_t:CDS:10 [Funneliformis mosseae]|uniref:6280_t:CDS:1 n=1 Tax=Funneliformis mosseae TaxID=27381 RepID=A0A9N8YYK6_FUNMO|nr:6280_t:CDS:10 [Funneliformis mosseae]
MTIFLSPIKTRTFQNASRTKNFFSVQKTISIPKNHCLYSKFSIFSTSNPKSFLHKNKNSNFLNVFENISCIKIQNFEISRGISTSSLSAFPPSAEFSKFQPHANSARYLPIPTFPLQRPVSSPEIASEIISSQETEEVQRVNEIKNAKLIFNQSWKNVEDAYGRENLFLPREIIWLMGAPGSGKGTHTNSLLKTRGITNPAISMSKLLTSPECQELINKGQMISDGKVLESLFRALLNCDPTVGCLVDGFPRTEIQVECLKLLYDKMHELRREFWETPLREKFPRPTFRICVLYVDEDVSVERQLMRGKQIKDHNAMVRRTHQGELIEERVTDYDEMLIRARYKIFKEHFGALMKLGKIFPFHLINAVGTIEEVMQVIIKEFEYQSSLELDHKTYDAIAHIPLATKISIHARQDLISRLEHYQETDPESFSKAIEFVDENVIPLVQRHAISGQTLVRTNSQDLENQHLVDMIMDVLSERGYHVMFDDRVRQTPVRINPDTWEIILEKRHNYMFSVRFPKHIIQPLEQKF